MTAHSLEPHRPWKAEQLGGGYRVSSWAEKTAVLGGRRGHRGVRRDARRDVPSPAYPALDPARVHVVHNGIDTDEYRPVEATDVLERHGVDPATPYALFVGRITRQKGVEHLLRAAASWPGQLVLCAGAPGHPGDRRRGREPWSPSCSRAGRA